MPQACQLAATSAGSAQLGVVMGMLEARVVPGERSALLIELPPLRMPG